MLKSLSNTIRNKSLCSFFAVIMLALLLLLLSSALGKGMIKEATSNESDVKRITDINKQLFKVVDAQVCDHTWIYYSQGTCHCGTDIRGTVRCSTDPDTVSVLAYICMTHDGKEGVITATCPFGYGDWYSNENLTSVLTYDPNYHVLPNNITELNNAMCGRMNRDGLLCSECRDGYSPLVYSYDLNCIKCSNKNYNWLKFIAVTFIPLTLFYFVVVFFRISATNPYLYGFITFNQVVAAPTNKSKSYLF